MRSALVLLIFVASALAVAGLSRAEGEAPTTLPGPAPRGRSAAYDVALENARCEGCHEDIAASWRGSLHQRSWVDPVFLSAYVIEPLPFCRGCHAPESDPQKSPSKGARSVGVGCVSCHVSGDEIVGVRTIPGRAGLGDAGHAVRADPRLSTTDACVSCHEFEFPLRKGALMQGTVTEHRASRHAGASCQTCHMKPERSASGRVFRGHGFSASKDVSLLRSAVVASAKARGERSFVVSLRAGEIGHAFPTGDMFRRLETRGFVVDEEDKPLLAAPPVVLERVFRSQSGSSGADRVEVRDDRVPASGEPIDIVVVFPEPIVGKRVRWEVAYRRMGEAMASTFGVDMNVDEVVVARGILRAGKNQ